MLCHYCNKWFSPYLSPRPTCLRTNLCTCWLWDYCEDCLLKKLGKLNPDRLLPQSRGGRIEMWFDPSGDLPPQNLPPITSAGVLGRASSFRCDADPIPPAGIGTHRPLCHSCQRIFDGVEPACLCARCGFYSHGICSTEIWDGPNRHFECNRCYPLHSG